jgi:membrane-associated phospholipid phosphatase
MTLVTVWAVMSYITVLSVLGAMRGIERATGISGEPSRRLGLWLAGGSILGLVALGVLYQIRDVADLDGRFVEMLADARGEALVAAFRVITTMGDLAPTFTIAAVLAVVLMRGPEAGYWPLMLPALMLLELAVQFGFSEVFPILVMDEVFPDVPIDGSGAIPSGATARLMTLFVVACLIYQRSYPRKGMWISSLGFSLVVVEIATRMLLGRHFVGDIIGGIFLGILLCLFSAALMSLSRRPTTMPRRRPSRIRDQRRRTSAASSP